jgi:hypothetical protein
MRGHLLDEDYDEDIHASAEKYGGSGGGRCCGMWREWAERGWDSFSVSVVPPTARGAFATLVLYPIVLVLFFIILLAYRYIVPLNTETTNDLTNACAPFSVSCTSYTGCVLSVGGSIPAHAAGMGWTPQLSPNTRAKNPGVFDANGQRLVRSSSPALDLQLCAGAGEFVDIASRDVALVPAGAAGWIVGSAATVSGSESVVFSSKGGAATTVQTVTWDRDGGFALQNPASVVPSFASYSPVVLSGGAGAVWVVWSGTDGSCSSGATSAWLVQGTLDGTLLQRTSVSGVSVGNVSWSDATSGLVGGSSGGSLQAVVPGGVQGATAFVGIDANVSAATPYLTANVWWGNGSVTSVLSGVPLPLTMEPMVVRGIRDVACGATEMSVIVVGGDGDVVLADLSLSLGSFVRGLSIVRSGGGANAQVTSSTTYTWVFTGGSAASLVVLQRSSYVIVDSASVGYLLPGNGSRIDVFSTSGDVLFALVGTTVCSFSLNTQHKISSRCSAVFPIQFAVSWALQPAAIIPSPVKPGDCVVAYNVRDPLSAVGGTWTTPSSLQELAGGGILTYMDAGLSIRVGSQVAAINSSLTLPVTGIAEDGEMVSLQPFVQINDHNNTRTEKLLLIAPQELDMSWPCPQTLDNYTSCIRLNLASTGITQTSTFALSWLQVVANFIGGISGLFILLRYVFVSPPFVTRST